MMRMMRHYMLLLAWGIVVLHSTANAQKCPTAQAKNDCVVNYRGRKYDFSLLRHKDYDIEYQNNIYSLSICGPLNTPCSETRKTDSLCKRANSTEAVGFGSIPNGLSTYSLKQRSSGGQDGKKYALTFRCGRGLGRPQVFGTESQIISILWETEYACAGPPPASKIPCTVKNGEGQTIDLSPLVRRWGNWVTESSDRLYYINICSENALVHTESLPKGCGTSPHSTICSVPRKAGVGLPTSDLGTLALPRYTDGEIETHVSSTPQPGADGMICAGAKIVFVCDLKVGLGSPKFIKKQKNVTKAECGTLFEWRTAAACPEQDTYGNDNTCAVYSPLDMFNYDFSELQDDITVTGNLTNYTVGICQKSISSQDETPIVFGSATSKILLKDLRTPTLLYKGTDSCDGGDPRNATVVFECDEEADINSTYGVVLSETNCAVSISIRTARACPPDLEATTCRVDDPETGDIYDLSPLRITQGNNWEVIGKDSCGTYYINVCEPLSRDDRRIRRCPQQSTICASRNALGVGSLHLYGQDSSLPVLQPDKSLVVTYPGSGDCHSEIHFICKPGSLGEPHLNYTDADNCVFYFVWETSAACPTEKVVGGSCAVVDPATNYKYDLSTLKTSGDDPAPVCIVTNTANGTGKSDIIRSILANGADRDLLVSTGCYDRKIGLFPFRVKFAEGLFTFQVLCNGTQEDPKCYSAKSSYGKALRNAVNHTIQCKGYMTASWAILPCSKKYDLFNSDVKHGYPLFGLAGDGLPYTCVYDCSLVADPTTLKRPNVAPPFTFLAKNASGAIAEFTGIISLCSSTNCGASFPGSVNSCYSSGDTALAGGLKSNELSIEDGRLSMKYLGDGPCFGEYGDTGLSTTVEFVCDLSDEPNPISLVDKRSLIGPHAESDYCTVALEWKTPLACPPQESSCVVEDSQGVQFDLSVLTKSDSNYRVESVDGSLIELNVCRSIESIPGVVGCHADSAACLLNSKTQGTNLGAPSAPQIDEIGLFIEYETSASQCALGVNNVTARRTRIDFICAKDTLGAPELVYHDECTYSFIWRTVAACVNGSSYHVDIGALSCSVVDPKTSTVYDLTPLRNEKVNWIATDDRESGKYKYEVNVCGPLLQGTTNCDGYGLCQQWTNDPNNYRKVGKPSTLKIDDDGLYLFFEDGQSCSTNGYNRSARIDMKCPMEDGKPKPGVIGAPQFLYENGKGECRYYFSWETSYACAVVPVEEGDCKVSNPLSGADFDFNGLTLDDDTYTMLDARGDHSLNAEMNVCDNSTCGSDVAGVCLTTSSGDKVNLGYASDTPVFDDGKIYIDYNGGKADGCSRDFKSRITMTCNRTRITPLIQIIAKERCFLEVQVDTYLACEPARPVECVAFDDKGNSYDLSPLSRADKNWIARDGRENNKYEYEINVCREIIHLPDNKDCMGASICQVSRTQDFAEKHLAIPQSPTFKNGSLVIFSDDGTPCGNYNRTSTIIFTCGSGMGVPVFLTEENCNYIFTWSTIAACKPGEVQTKTLTDECEVEDTAGLIYDLQPLQGLEFVALNAHKNETREFKLGICSPVECGDQDNVTVCEDDTISHGKMSPSIEMHGKVAVVTYVSDEKCSVDGSDDFVRSVIILECGEGGINFGKGKPQFIDQADDCTYIFKWRTNLICHPTQREVSCVVSHADASGVVKTYDFSGLRLTSDNWVAVDTEQQNTNSSHVYYINVCRSLTPIPNHTECNGAALCQLKASDPEFGHPIGVLDSDSSPSISDNGEIIMKFPASPIGENCKGFKRTSKILFTCLPGKIGAPVFVGESAACEYTFEWATYAACDRSVTQMGSDCKVTDPIQGTEYDLSSLRNRVFNVSEPERPIFSYNIAVCSELPYPCGDTSSVSGCQYDSRASKAFAIGNNNAAISVTDGSLQIEYTNGTMCDGIPRSFVIQFECDPNAGDGQPVFEKETACKYLFKWKSALACAGRQLECVTTDPSTGNVYDLRPLILQDSGAFWEGENYIKAQYLKGTMEMNLCRSLSNRGCSANAAVCLQTEGYSLEVARMANPKFLNGKLVMSYDMSKSDWSCEGGASPKFEIEFVCDQGNSNIPTNHPVLVSFENSCQWGYKWVTKAACPVQTVYGNDCKVTDPVTGITIDINKIDDYDYAVNNTKGWKYRFSGLCAGRETSATQTTKRKTYNIGYVNSTLIMKTSTELQMTLRGGDKCSKGNERQTDIIFVCDATAAPDQGPKECIEEEYCTYKCIWPTSLACLTENCVTESKKDSCSFPFVYQGQTFYSCVSGSPPSGSLDSGKSWCATKSWWTDSKGWDACDDSTCSISPLLNLTTMAPFTSSSSAIRTVSQGGGPTTSGAKTTAGTTVDSKTTLPQSDTTVATTSRTKNVPGSTVKASTRPTYPSNIKSTTANGMITDTTASTTMKSDSSGASSSKKVTIVAFSAVLVVVVIFAVGVFFVRKGACAENYKSIISRTKPIVYSELQAVDDDDAEDVEMLGLNDDDEEDTADLSMGRRHIPDLENEESLHVDDDFDESPFG
eukprot:m.52469 g.52469  ORF g.52469 m.52469 type:complete len:2511 (+) comp10795_c0_seq1:159-7691(+)